MHGVHERTAPKIRKGEIIEFSRLNDMVQILVTADTLDELTEAYWADERNIKWFDGFKDWVIYHLCGFAGRRNQRPRILMKKSVMQRPVTTADTQRYGLTHEGASAESGGK